MRNNPVQYVKPYWFVVSEKVMSPFSFFRYIFWNRETRLESPEGQQILQHELAHLTEKHSIDKLLLEVITAFCWINPFFHLMKRELALIHEFIADKKPRPMARWPHTPGPYCRWRWVTHSSR
ncbi:hypothetical protein MKQ70_18770 [Chitinophaga sedimenti]|uniref:M56 family metallopeptidase n=1 Tax=Chitinophaga sedimenti TaxID=2033606 RepID=UPI0020065C54|nr:M56 family metallopeptidase [Chitinophaga sedimenti]MCK7556945.1 hypothetical protein [Chitinophaga sedimenti]